MLSENDSSPKSNDSSRKLSPDDWKAVTQEVRRLLEVQNPEPNARSVTLIK